MYPKGVYPDGYINGGYPGGGYPGGAYSGRNYPSGYYPPNSYNPAAAGNPCNALGGPAGYPVVDSSGRAGCRTTGTSNASEVGVGVGGW